MTVPGLVEASVPERLPGAVVRGPVVEAAPETVLIRLPLVGRFLVRAEGPARVERAPGATDADLRCFAAGPVAAAAALLRGAIPLRAAAVVIGGRAVAIAGVSGAGKSGVAAALALRGHRVLADAVTVVEPSGGLLVQPLAPEPVLWPDLVEQLELDPAAGRVVRPQLAKRAFDLSPASSAERLGAVVILGREALLEAPVATPVAGPRKVTSLLRLAWHSRLVEPLELAGATLGQVAAIASSSDVVSVMRPRDGCSVAALARVVEEQVA